MQKKIEEIKPTWLINCAAYTNVDKAEEEFDKANFVNGYAIKGLSETLKEIDCNLIQISTDYVFDGKASSPYKTTHQRNPINKYGEGKSIGENFVEKILFPFNSSKIIRTSWLMSSLGNNFAKTIFNLHKTRTEFKVISDQVGSFTCADTLSKFIWEIILKEEKGIKTPNILHFTNSGICSWFDIAIAIGELSEKNKIINKKSKVIPISSEDFKSKVKRPSYSVLDCLGMDDLFNEERIYWRNALEKIIKELSIESGN